MKFDDILKNLGDFGRYQLIVYFAVSFSTVFTVFHKMAWVFLGATPKFRCFLPIDTIANRTLSYELPQIVLNESLPWNDKQQQWDKCIKYTGNKSLSNLTTETCNKWVYDTSTYTNTVISEFDLVCDRNLMGSLLLTLNYVGECIGSTLTTLLSDRIGRKKSLIVCLSGLGITGITISFIQSYYAFAFIRVLQGGFAQGIFLISFVLAVEYVGVSKRGIAGNAFNYFFGFGYLIEAGIAYMIRNWRYLQLAIAIPSLLYSIVILWVPESARWLIAVDRIDDAKRIIQKAAKVNKRDLPDNLKLDAEVNEDMKLKEIVKIPSIFVRILLLCFIWFSIDAVYFGLALNTSSFGGNDYLNFFISALLEIPAYTASIFMAEYCGRKISLSITLFLSGLPLLALIFIPDEMTTLKIIMAMTGKFSSTIAFAVIYVFSIELYPTQVRNAALGLNSTMARFGGMVSSLISLLKAVWLPLPWLILGTISLISGILILLLPETKNLALPENFNDALNILKSKKQPQNTNPKPNISNSSL